MIKRPARAFGALVFLLFLGGSTLLPLLPDRHCADHHAVHDSANCPICQLSHSPSVAPVPEPVPAPEGSFPAPGYIVLAVVAHEPLSVFCRGPPLLS